MKNTINKSIVTLSLLALIISMSAYASATSLIARGEYREQPRGQEMQRNPYEQKSQQQQYEERNRAQGYEHGYQQGSESSNQQSPTIIVPQQPDLYQQETQQLENYPY